MMSPDKALEVGIDLAKAQERGFFPSEIGPADARLTATTLAALRVGLPMLIAAAEKFVNKCDTGRARSVETYKEMKAALAALAPEGGQT